MRRRALMPVLLACAAVAPAQVISGGGLGNATALQGTPVASTAPANGNCLVYSASGLNWAPSSCSGTASTAWAAITSGTNTGAAMVVGSGANLSTSGSGTIAATTAAALAATPGQCTGGQFATGIAASGAANCATPAGSGGSAGTNTLQVSNGSGGFITSGDLEADTTNGYFGDRNPSGGALTTPLDVEWTGIAGTASGFTLATFNCGLASTASSPGDLHCVNGDAALAGTSTFSGAGATDAIYYTDLVDSRAPAGASTVGHEMPFYAVENFDGGANLTCTVCAAGWFDARFGGAGGTVTSLAGINAEFESISGTGVIAALYGVNVSVPNVASGPAVDNLYGVEVNDIASLGHGTGGSGCIAGVAVGACAGTAAYAYFSGSSANSALAAGLALGTGSLGNLGGTRGVDLDVEGTANLGGLSGYANEPPLCFYGWSSGSPNNCISAITGGQTYKLPSDSGTLMATAGTYDASGAITGNLAPQTLYSFPDGNSRFFRVAVYGVCTAAVAGGTVAVNVGYTDEQQAQVQTSSAQSCAAAGDIVQFTALLYANTSNVTVSTTTVSSPQYRLHARIELLGPNSINSQ